MGHIEVWVERLHEIFRAEQMHQLPLVEEAFGRQAQALILQLDAACQAADQLAEAAIEAFKQHRTPRSSSAFPAWAS